MTAKGKKLVSLFLVFSLMAISCASLRTTGSKREKHGVKLIVTKKDGQQIRGELITVKPNSLLLLNIIGRDVSVGIADIKVIRVVKKSKVLHGIGLGLLIGGGTGALIGFSGGDDTSGFMSFTAAEKALLGGIFLGAIGLLVGGALGFVSGIDKTILVEDKSPRWIEFYLKKLRSKARIPDYK